MYIAERLDDIGKPAWIALMVVSFIIWWPIGLAILGFLLWSGRMGCGCGHYGRMSWHERRERWREAREEWRAMRRGYGRFPSSGNVAFDEYRAETLKRLEEEQREFSDFLNRLRRTKDKAEFDEFMRQFKDRPAPPSGPEPTPQS